MNLLRLLFPDSEPEEKDCWTVVTRGLLTSEDAQRLDNGREQTRKTCARVEKFSDGSTV